MRLVNVKLSSGFLNMIIGMDVGCIICVVYVFGLDLKFMGFVKIVGGLFVGIFLYFFLWNKINV